jgi:hypothetical protein
LFPVVAGLYYALAVSGFINNLRLAPPSQSYLFAGTNSLSLLLSLLAIATVFSIELLGLQGKGQEQSYLPFSGLRDAKKWYIPLFLLKLILTAGIIELGIAGSFDSLVFVLFGLELCYFLLLILSRPYLLVLHNIGAIFCELTAVYAFSLPLLERFANI